MRNLFLKVVSLVAILLLIASVGMAVSAYGYPDEGYWANEAIDAAIENGLLRGKDDGKMHSEDNLTRAEMAAIMVRSFGATIEADISMYTDLKPSAWYYKDFAKAVQMKVFEGDGSGKMRPDDFITREEVFTVVARALVLNDSNYAALDKFNDKSQISDWAKGYMSILTQKSYVNGDNLSNANPKKNITRAEFAQLMHNIFRNYYTKASTYSDSTDSRSSMINVGDVTFKNMTVNGDLVIGDGNAKGTIHLENVNIKGRLLVRGSQRVELVNTTVGEMVVVNNYNTVVHFDNYRDEKVFDNIVLNTEATFKEKASEPVKPTPGGGGGGGGGATTSYTVTYDVDGGTSISNGKAYKDKDFTLPGANATTKTGYKLKGWIVNGTEYAPGSKVSGISSNITVKAVWEIETYIITYNTDGGTPLSNGSVVYGSNLVLPQVGATTKEGYTLKGWIVNGTEYAPGATVSGITADTTVKAVWEANVYNITFDTDGGSAVNSTTVAHGGTLTLPDASATSKTGCVLTGWIVNGITYAPGSTVSGITADTTIKAVWDSQTYTVTFDTDGGTPLANGTAKYGEDFVLPGSNSTSKDGFYLKGWMVDGTEYAPGATVSNINANTTIKAVWGAITPETKYGSYVIKYYKQNTSLNGYDYVSADDESSNNVVVGNYSITPDANKYTGFVLNSNYVSITKEIKENETTVFEVYYDRQSYTVTYNTDGGSTVANGTAYYGVGFKLPDANATTKTGWVFKGWVVNGTTYNGGATVSGITSNTVVKALWERETYTITYNTDGGSVVANGTATFGYGFTLPAANSTVKEGYTLKGWIVNGTEYAPGATVSGITANTTIKAVWKVDVYTITYDTDGGSAIASTTVEYGKNLTLPAANATTKTGYNLTYWTVNGVKYAPGATVSGITANTTIKAVWEAETYTVTINTDGGTPLANATAKYGEDFVLPGSNATSKDGFYLKGWIVDGVEYAPGATVSGITSNTTIKAVWGEVTPETKYGSYVIKYYKQNTTLNGYDYISADDESASNIVVGNYSITPNADKYVGFVINTDSVYITKEIKENETTVFEVYYDRETYTVTYNTDGGNAVANGTAYYGVDYTLANAAVKAGWLFKGWVVNGTTYNAGATISVTEDTVAKATWERETYTVTFDTNGGTPIANGTATFGYGFTLPAANATTKEGHTLRGWIVNGREYVSGTTVSGIAADTTIKAVWDVNVYEVTYDVDGGSAVASTTVAYGETLTLPAEFATTKTGYTLGGWIVGGVTYAPGATVSGITADIIIKAVWENETYTITFDTNGGTPIADSTATFGETFVLPSVGDTTKDGYDLKGWIVNGTEYAPGASVSGITADTTIIAVWDAETYTVTFDTNGGTPIANDTAIFGESFVLPSVGDTTKDGYDLKGWIVNGTEYAPGTAVSGITEDTVIKAVWGNETYTITFDTDGGTPLVNGTAVFGEDFVLPSVGDTTKDGYNLKGWIVDGTEYAPGTAVSGITADTVIKAVWENETYTITFDTNGGTPIADSTATFGETFVLPGVDATTKDGYNLKGWIVDGTEYAPGASVTGITADTTIKAVWDEVTPETKYGSYVIKYYKQDTNFVYQHVSDEDESFSNVVVGDFTVTPDADKYVGFDLNEGYVSITKEIKENELTVFEVYYDREAYTVTYNTDGGSAVADATVYFGIDFILPGSDATTKEGFYLKAWSIDGTEYALGATVSGITSDITVTAVWEEVTPETKYGSYVIKYYKQNDEGEYIYVEGADESGTAVVGSFTISPNANKYKGYILNADNVYTLDITEGVTTEFKVYYDIIVEPVVYNKVTFYFRKNVVGSTEVINGTTVAEEQFPDYGRTYTDGYVKDSTIASVYEEPYQHTVDYGWWYNAKEDKWEEFTTETVVDHDIDVYLKIQKFNAIVTLGEDGEQFNFYAFYESDTRFKDTIKDILYKGGPLQALKVAGYWDTVRENGITQKILDEDDNLRMIKFMIRFSQIIGEENMETFIIDNAKEMFASGNNELLHDAFVEYLMAVANSSNEADKKKVHDLMEETINHVFEEDTVSADTLALIKELCNDALSDPATFEEVTGIDYDSLSKDTRTFVVDYIIDELSNNDELFAEVVKEVTGVTYTDTTTTKDLIIAMAEKQLEESFDSTIDDIKDSQKDLIVETVNSMLTEDGSGLYDEVLTYAKENEKDVIVSTIKSLIETEDSLYETVVDYITGSTEYKPMLITTVKDLLTDNTSTMYDDVMGVVASEENYRSMVAQAIGTELATNDALFETLTGVDLAYITDQMRADAIDDLVADITADQNEFENVITDAENAGYKSLITNSIINELDTNSTFFDSVFAEAKDSYKDVIANKVTEEIGAVGNDALFEEVVGYAKDDYKGKIVDVIVDKLEEDNSPMYDKVIELAKTDSYKQTIINAIIDTMNGANGDDMISAITGCTSAELAKDPQDKNGYIMNKAKDLLDDDAYFGDLMDAVTGKENYVLPATPKDFIIDMVVEELMDTESTSSTRDMIIEEAIAYLLAGQDQEDIEHLADYAIEYLATHPDQRDEMVDAIINDVYKEQVDKLVYQLINEEQFEVTADTIFVAEGLKKVLLEDYNYETFFGSKIPDVMDNLFKIYPEEKIIELYDFALNNLIAQVDVAIEDALAGETGYIDCGITPYVNIISDFYQPLHDSFKKILETATEDIYYYNANVYLQELVKLLDPEVWVQGTPSEKPSDVTGYKIYDLDYYYNLYYKIYVLNDDVMMWYYENLVEPTYIRVTENYKELILKYANVMLDKINAYATDGTIPDVHPQVNDKLSAAEEAVMKSYPELVSAAVDKYKSTNYYTDGFTEVDYDKICDRIHETFEEPIYFTTDNYFDVILDQSIYEKVDDLINGEYYTKIDDNTYEVGAKGYKIRFIRELKETLY